METQTLLQTNRTRGGSIIDPEIQMLKYKRKTGIILDILRARSTKEDVEDLINTIESLLPLLNRILTQLTNFDKNGLDFLLEKLQIIDEYEATVSEMENSGKLKRLLTNSRLRKKLEKLNADLHKQIEQFVEIIIQIEVKNSEKIQTETKTTPKSATTANQPARSIGIKPQNKEKITSNSLDDPENRYANFSELSLSPDLFKDDWDNSFFSDTERQMVSWSQFINFLKMKRKLTITPDDEIVLKYVLDNSNTGLCSKHKFSEFLKGFGPEERCIQNVKAIFFQPYFYGYLSIKEAELLLIQQPIGTFLVRLDRAGPGTFSFAFVYAPKQVIHILVNSKLPLGFGIFDEESGEEKIFKSLSDIVNTYRQVLMYPFNSSLPLQPWFQGEVTGDEAIDILRNRPSGTFIIRFSSQVGFLAASYVDANNEVRHSLIEHIVSPEGESFQIPSESISLSSLEEFIQHYSDVLLYPLKSENEIDLCKVKQIVGFRANTFEETILTSSNSIQSEVQPFVDTLINENNAEIQPSVVENLQVQGNELSPSSLVVEDLSGELKSLLSHISPTSKKEEDNVTEIGAIPETVSKTASSVSNELEEKKRIRALRHRSEKIQYNCIATLNLVEMLKQPARILYLFNDNLSLTSDEFPLWTTWLESMSDNFQGGKGFRIITPEKRLVVCSRDKEEKNRFLELANRQILQILERDGCLLSSDKSTLRRFVAHTFSDGSFYEGEWESGVFDGQGTHLTRAGKYVGTFVKGLRDGKGIYTEEDGTQYEGQFKDNLKDGYGELTIPTEDSILIYKGSWKQDQKSGYGELFLDANSIVFGEWLKNLPAEKYSSLIFSNGDRFVGSMIVSENSTNPLKLIRNGFGIMNHINGSRFIGMWKNDVPHGHGYCFEGNTQFQGTWIEGVIQEQINEIPPFELNFATVGWRVEYQQNALVLSGEQWKDFFLEITSKNSPMSKLLEDKVLQSPDQVADTLFKILSTDNHFFGIAIELFSKIITLNYKIFDQNQIVPLEQISSDIYSFISLMITNILQKFQILNTEHGTFLIWDMISTVLFPKIYATIIERFVQNYSPVDEILEKKKNYINSLDIIQQFHFLGINEKYFGLTEITQTPFVESVEILQALPTLILAHEKMGCLVNTIRSIEAFVFQCFGENDLGDQIIPFLCFVVSKYPFPNFYVDLKFIEEFLHGSFFQGSEGYFLTQFITAANLISALEIPQEQPTSSQEPPYSPLDAKDEAFVVKNISTSCPKQILEKKPTSYGELKRTKSPSIGEMPKSFVGPIISQNQENTEQKAYDYGTLDSVENFEKKRKENLKNSSPNPETSTISKEEMDKKFNEMLEQLAPMNTPPSTSNPLADSKSPPKRNLQKITKMVNMWEKDD